VSTSAVSATLVSSLPATVLVNMGILSRLPRAIELPEVPNIALIAKFALYSSTIAVRTVWLLQVGENKGEDLKKF
jgi:hypothetical protein